MAVKSLIETVTVGAGGAASIEFLDIPQDGGDLVLQVSGRMETTVGIATTYFNNDTTASNYTNRNLTGTSSVGSNSFTGFSILTNPSSYTADTFASSEVYISNYTSSAQKSISKNEVRETNATTGYVAITATSWLGTAPITSIKLEQASVDFAEFTTASLYKIKYD